MPPPPPRRDPPCAECQGPTYLKLRAIRLHEMYALLLVAVLAGGLLLS